MKGKPEVKDAEFVFGVEPSFYVYREILENVEKHSHAPFERLRRYVLYLVRQIILLK